MDHFLNDNKMQPKVVIRRSKDGNSSIRIYSSLSGTELCVLLFDEKPDSNEVKIVDLFTKQKFKGYGTFATNILIQFCKKNYSENAKVYGSSYHQEYVGSHNTILEEINALQRIRRNKFWKEFGFNVILINPIYDRIEAVLSDLYCKTNNFISLNKLENLIVIDNDVKEGNV